MNKRSKAARFRMEDLLRIPGSRTREKAIYELRSAIFDNFGFQKMINLREKYALEDAMGFRGQFDEHRRFQIQMLQDQGLKPHHRLLEIGCGPLTLAIPAIQFLDVNRYVGVDVRSSVLNLAWHEIAKFQLSEKNPRLICASDFGDNTIGGDTFDFVLSFSVLFHLSDDLLNSYFASVARRLSSNGVCLVNVNTTASSDKWLEFPFLKRSINDYVRVAQRHRLTVENLGAIKDLGFRNEWGESEYPLLRISLE